jgi:TatD DNase family protein
MLIDTHCHLNFKVFRSQLPAVLERAQKVGVEQMVVVGSQLKNSQRAVEQAQAHEAIFAAVGVHPHHVWDYLEKAKSQAKIASQSLETVMNEVTESVSAELIDLVRQPKVVAVGEIGLDYHQFEQTQYEDKAITPDYKFWQERFFLLQAKIANDSNKAIIIHNREAVNDLLSLLTKHAYLFENNRIVFHCCEAEPKLLAYAVEHHHFIGVDGDVTFDQAKTRIHQASAARKLSTRNRFTIHYSRTRQKLLR